jgi:hypothetical protein
MFPRIFPTFGPDGLILSDELASAGFCVRHTANGDQLQYLSCDRTVSQRQVAPAYHRNATSSDRVLIESIEQSEQLYAADLPDCKTSELGGCLKCFFCVQWKVQTHRFCVP